MKNNVSIEEYISVLSSNSPTPGGGSAAALSGALSSALTSMVFNLTIGKKSYENYAENIKEKIIKAQEECKKYNELLLTFMKKDEEAFMSLMKAFKLAKDTEEEKLIRRGEIEKGYRNAIEVPLALAKEGLELYKYIAIAAQYGSLNVISDAGVGAILLCSTIESSILNVHVNLKGIKDERYKDNISSECGEVLKKASNYKSDILEKVYLKIK